MAPALFLALKVAHTLDKAHYPITSAKAVEAAVRAIQTEPDEFSHVGLKITVAGARRHFHGHFLPVTDKVDLLRKLYHVILIAHRESARATWHRAQVHGVNASHPLPTEGF